MRCAVLGSPIKHSLSPALHRAAYAELGLSWSYEAIEVAEGGLAGFLESLGPGWRGLSLTMPLKREAMAIADSLDPWARLSGVANTLLLGDSRRLAFNTDIPGAKAALAERGVDQVRSAVVLGSGATAASVLLAVADLGCRRATLVVRDPSRAGETLAAVRNHPRAPEVAVTTFAQAPREHTDLLVSTIPAAAQTEDVLALTTGAPNVFEVVYDPWPTPLAQSVQETARTLVNGLDLLAHQAVLQIQLMTGQDVPVDLVRRAGLAELDRRAGDNAHADL